MRSSLCAKISVSREVRQIGNAEHSYGRIIAQNKLTKTFVKSPIPQKKLAVVFKQLKWDFRNVQMTKVPIQTQIMCSVKNYMQTIFDQEEQSTKALHMNLKEDILSMGLALFQNARRIYAEVARPINNL